MAIARTSAAMKYRIGVLPASAYFGLLRRANMIRPANRRQTANV